MHNEEKLYFGGSMATKRKKYTMIIMAFGLIFLSIVCIFTDFRKQSDTGESIPIEKIVLEVYTARGDAGWNNVLDELEKRFEKENSHIDIVIRRDSGAELYDESLTILDSQGKLGDIIELRNWDFLAADRLGRLPDTFRDDVVDIYEQEGYIYGLRMAKNSVGMIYNKNIFSSLDLNEPVTYDDFLELCRVVKVNGYTPIALGGGDLWHMQFLLDSYYYKDVLLSNINWDVQLRDGTSSWRDEEIIHMLGDLKELIDEGYVESSWSVDRDSMMAAKLASGKVAMVCSGPWIFSPIMEQNADIELGWFYIPDERGMTIAKNNGSSYWAITKECELNDDKYCAAVSFLQFVYSDEIDQYICQRMGNISTTKGGRNYELTSIQEELREDYGKASFETTKGINDNCMPVGFRQHALSIVKKYLMGSLSLQQAMGQLQEAYEKCLDTE